MQSSALVFDAIGAWVAFVFTLMIFSALAETMPWRCPSTFWSAPVWAMPPSLPRHVILPGLSTR